ncbi:MAG: methyltransferase domain-containing protein [Gammaproteobacteria bacterium]|nr:MAG: methyltransferase domain-containing protein [Gammaproteobacteria bacterium]
MVPKRILPARLDSRSVQAAYGRIAPVYDLWGRATESAAQDAVLEWLEAMQVRHVVDVATGTGALLEKLLTVFPGATGVGVDLTAAMLRKAADRLARFDARCALVRGDARRLPIPSESSDLVTNAYMFDLLPETEFSTVLQELGRVLVPGGHLALINMTTPERPVERIWERIYQLYPALLGGCRGVSLEKYLASGRFRVLRRARVSQFAFPSEIILAAKQPGGASGKSQSVEVEFDNDPA